MICRPPQICRPGRLPGSPVPKTATVRVEVPAFTLVFVTAPFPPGAVALVAGAPGRVVGLALFAGNTMRALVLEKERTYLFGTIVVVLLGEGLLLRTGSIGVRGARVRLGILYLNG